MYQWRTGRSCIYKNTVHLVFVTKYRRDVFTISMLETLNEIFTETCQQMDCELLEFGGEDDHVHMMVSVHPKIAISNLVGKLKGKSSYMLRKNYWGLIKKKLWGNHFWSPSYCVVSCGGASLTVPAASRGE
jgi:putative transposase